jgi:hypothetical protein
VITREQSGFQIVDGLIDVMVSKRHRGEHTVRASTNTPELNTPANIVPGAEAIRKGFMYWSRTT